VFDTALVLLIVMAGPPGPRKARPEDKPDLPATHRVRVGGRKEFPGARTRA